MGFGIFDPKRRAYRHIFFDLDNTLWDFEQNKVDALRDVFSDYGLGSAFPSVEVFIDTFTRHNDYLWDKYREGALTKATLRYKRFEQTLLDYGISNAPLAQALGEGYLRVMPLKTALVAGAAELLDYLGLRYRLHIVSNGFSEVQRPKLERSGIAHHFEQVVTSDDVGYHKPDPRIFGLSLSRVNAKKAESIMVGDNFENDIEGAKRFGIDQIYLNPKGNYTKFRATYEVRSLGEIRQIL